MSREEISKNVMAAINGIAEIVPRKWGGIRSFHLKFLSPSSFPIKCKTESEQRVKLKLMCWAEVNARNEKMAKNKENRE
ncbi:hypothetical protein NC651_007739 [Populus alba x Populus x berolinensis]|nr:hypothetical protein NC651_007739 [Populus alba x Populus x berolinensis]